MIIAAVAFGAAEIVAGLLPSYVAFAIWTPVIGIASLTMITSANATVQIGVAPDMRGRVMALYMLVSMGGTPLGSPIVGWVGETFGARWTLIGGGVVTILGTALAVLVFSRAQGLIGRSHEQVGHEHDRVEHEVGAAGEVVAGQRLERIPVYREANQGRCRSRKLTSCIAVSIAWRTSSGIACCSPRRADSSSENDTVSMNDPSASIASVPPRISGRILLQTARCRSSSP